MERLQIKNCDTCNNKDCGGHLDYDNLCANLNYLKEYGQKNYEKNTESFIELKELMKDEMPIIFSFGAGIGLDCIGAKEVFGERVGYFLIDETQWAITKTDGYKRFKPELPGSPMSFREGMLLLKEARKNAVICFFNSLFTISENTDLRNELLRALANKTNFYLVCNYTYNSNFHLPSAEIDFLKGLVRELKHDFNIKKHELNGDKGVLITGERK